MTGETVLIPGGREVRGTLDRTGGDAVVVLLPPHPQHGGTRSDRRLRGVSDAVGEADIDALRVDYGAWDRGRGEVTDATNAVAWARARYDRVGLFGYSFGGAVALATAANDANGPNRLSAVSVLAPPARLTDHLDAVAALDAVAVPVQVLYGERDDLVDWAPVVERARELGHEVVSWGADHHFVGQHEAVGSAVREFFVGNV
jgi:hypothetical protein